MQVGDERARVAAGEAVLWPAGVVPRRLDGAAREMRAIVVEFAGADDAPARDPRRAGAGIAAGGSAPAAGAAGAPVLTTDGELAARPRPGGGRRPG